MRLINNVRLITRVYGISIIFPRFFTGNAELALDFLQIVRYGTLDYRGHATRGYWNTFQTLYATGPNRFRGPQWTPIRIEVCRDRVQQRKQRNAQVRARELRHLSMGGPFMNESGGGSKYPWGFGPGSKYPGGPTILNIGTLALILGTRAVRSCAIIKNLISRLASGTIHYLSEIARILF